MQDGQLQRQAALYARRGEEVRFQQELTGSEEEAQLRHRERCVCVRVYTHTYTYMHIHTYIYICHPKKSTIMLILCEREIRTSGKKKKNLSQFVVLMELVVPEAPLAALLIRCSSCFWDHLTKKNISCVLLRCFTLRLCCNFLFFFS